MTSSIYDQFHDRYAAAPLGRPTAADGRRTSTQGERRVRAGTSRAVGVAASVLLIAIAAASCRNGDDEAAADNRAEAVAASALNPADRDELTEGGTLRWGLNEFPAQWNPHHADGNLATVGTVMAALMPYPFRTDEDGVAAPDPDYVEDVEVRSSDGAGGRQVLTLRLNPEARWSDGTPITWRDYAAMARALAGEQPGYRTLGGVGYDRISSVDAGKDEFEVVIAFDRPFAEYAALFAPLLPAAYTESADRFDTGYREDIPVTAGPFAFDGIDRGAQTLTVRRSEDWWGTPAKLDRIIFRTMAPEALDSAFLDGGIDTYALPLDSASYERASSAADGEVRAALAPDYRHITLNGQSDMLSDVDVRHAVFQGIDREVLIQAAFGSIEPPRAPLGNHLLLEGRHGYADNSGTWGDFDPEHARELLDAAGWTVPPEGGTRTRGGTPLSVDFLVPRGHSPARDEAELVQGMLADIGIDVRIDPVAGDKLFSDYVLPGRYDMVAFVNTGGGFPLSATLQQWSSPVTGADGTPEWRANVGRISSPEIDRALEGALETLDPDEALRRINEADRLLWEAGHTLPLYQRPELVAARHDIANLGAVGFGTLDYADIGYLDTP
ncbi:peptide/nickel transport system substrate-binding protein [Nocardiopsis mwathae]|uniref:Peptide/nickel transport system substrate-binding protein n=1 Tax=Nocardiopsis mwathae TaxID=1472723 RepID=A0A7X0D5V2_9ACTN|nr:ABC transporter family substrate-binding protein [Nocardiopsis mwathae]MBB6172847.1 peptide/nickel transport system substrate-binding protein [Nocardiopsis mwathae]